MLKKLSYALFGLLACVGLAVAGGNFNFWPIVGGAAYNCSTVNGVSVCTVPAGPSALTGNELIPADTQLAQGIPPQTVLVPSSIFANGAILVSAAANTSVVIPNGVNTLVFNATVGTIPQITLPPNPMNNQVVTIANAGAAIQTITTIAVGTSGQSIVGTAPTALAVGTATTAVLNSVAYMYQVSNTTWYRIQ